MANKYAGTQTEKNLEAAFAGESQARNKYTYFASVAKKEGYEQISSLFLKTADNEKEHAKMWFKELEGIGSTAQNLEEAANGIEDEFLKKGVMLVVDGTDPELVRGIMEADLMCVEARHKTNIGFWDKWAALGPAWGMIGTLIGLINMLKLMDDPSTVGPSMAIALITTLYGSIIANWLCTPTSAKLKVNNDTEIMIKEVTVEGLLSIQAGENPRVIEEKLKSFLSPKMRENMLEQGGGEE